MAEEIATLPARGWRIFNTFDANCAEMISKPTFNLQLSDRKYETLFHLSDRGHPVDANFGIWVIPGERGCKCSCAQLR